MRELTIDAFSHALASAESVPGGGGTSALVSALAAGLNVMVGCLTAGKKKYASVEDEIRLLTGEAEDIRERLLELIDEDAKCFEPLSRVYSMPKDAPERDELMERCLVSAASAPMEIAELSCRVIVLSERFADIGSRLALSDAGCAAELARSALRCAALNVFANTGLMKNRETAALLNAKVDAMLERCSPIAEKTYAYVSDSVKKPL